MASMKATSGPRTDAAMRTLCAALAAALAVALGATHVANGADAAHDPGVVRVLGLAPRVWRAVDVLVGNALTLLPVGTRVARAALGGVLVSAAAAVVLCDLAERLLASCAPTRRLRFVVAAIASCAAVFGTPWQIEAAAVGGSVTGAVLIMAPLALAARSLAVGTRRAWLLASMSLGLALGHEPLVGVCALAGVGALLGTSRATRQALADMVRAHGRLLGMGLLAGLAPLVVAIAHTRAAGLPLAPALGDAWLGEPEASPHRALGAFAAAEIGAALGVLGAGGCLLAALVPQARPLASGLVAVVAAGFGCAWGGSPLGPTRFGAAPLAALACVAVLAAVSMQTAVRAVASTRVPLARASAAMTVVIELVIPVEAADGALLRAGRRSTDAEVAVRAWDDAAWGTLPPQSVVLLTDPTLVIRARAGQAQGALRGDLLLVQADVGSSPSWDEFARAPALVAVWRDLALSGAPTEASLSSLATERPLVLAYEPRWGAAIARHLVPFGLFDRFEPEPRGSSDRRRALDAWSPARERLSVLVAEDPDLARASAGLLRARALMMASGGDRALAERAAQEARAFVR